MTTDLVGPVVAFHDGTQVAYKPPRDTMDPRYEACADHHTACDCREAERSEDRNEHKVAMDEAREIIAHLIDAPCPVDKRMGCEFCRGALGSWLGRYASCPRRTQAPF